MSKISRIHAREVLDSRGFPTVEAQVFSADGHVASAIVPSGASTGIHEALELRDGDRGRFLGKGVLKAVNNVRQSIAKALEGFDLSDHVSIDRAMMALDGTKNKSNLGANAILAVSLATARLSALCQGKTLALWIDQQSKTLGLKAKSLAPVPLMNVINGGAHANNGLDVQEFMLVPHGFSTFSEALRAGAEVFHHLKANLSSSGLSTAVGDEGGFAPTLKSNREALERIMKAIEVSGYHAGKHISLALDVAASEFFKDGAYHLKDKSVGTVKSDELVSYYAKLAADFPLVSIEDGMAEDDWDGWCALTKAHGQRLQLVGDDLFVTQVPRLKIGLDKQAANSILIKLNQVGTLTETLETMALAQSHDYASVASHRSGESEDTFLAHLAVGTGCGQIKTGSASRSERVAKYNELLRLEEELSLGLAKPFRS